MECQDIFVTNFYCMLSLWLPWRDTLLAQLFQWDDNSRNTQKKGMLPPCTCMDLLNMHISTGLTAAGSLCALRSVARRCNSSLHLHFLSLFKTHGREEVQDTWHCSWLSNSVRISLLRRMLPSQGEPSEMILLCEHGMQPLQLHSS